MAKVEGGFSDRREDIVQVKVSADIKENWELLVEHMSQARNIFKHADGLVLVGTNPEDDSLVIMRMTVGMIQVEASRYIRFYKSVKKKGGDDKIVFISCPPDAAKVYLDRADESLHPTLGGISYAPLIDRKSGDVTSKRGYDIRSRQFVDAPEVDIMDKPKRRDALEALARLRHTFRTLPYADSPRITDEDGNNSVDLSKDPGFDESSFLIGGVVTAVARASIPLAPMLVIDAPTGSGSGVGKGLATHACAMLAQGKKANVITFGDSQEEFEKRLSAAAIQGWPTLMLDNFNARNLGGSNLNSLITESPSRIRVLGSSTIAEIPQRMWICANGTGIRVREDLARRVNFVMLDSHMENPEERRFSFNLLHDVYERRAELLSDVMTILRWGILNRESLPQGVSMGSFELWSTLVRDPMVALGCQDPARLRSKIRQQDPERELWTEIFEFWWQHHQDKPVCFGNVQKGYTMMNPQLREMLYEVLAPKQDPDSMAAKRTLSRALSIRHRMILAGYQLNYKPRVSGHDQAVYWLARAS